MLGWQGPGLRAAGASSRFLAARVPWGPEPGILLLMGICTAVMTNSNTCNRGGNRDHLEFSVRSLWTDLRTQFLFIKSPTSLLGRDAPGMGRTHHSRSEMQLREPAARKARMPQVVYRELGNTSRRGFSFTDLLLQINTPE